MMSNGINQIGIPKFQHPWRPLQTSRNSGTWGNRGKGNEIQSALEKTISIPIEIGKKGVNYIKNKFNKKQPLREYIGGTPSQSREKYFSQDSTLLQAISDLSNAYEISPELIMERLGHEGAIDASIRTNNAHRQSSFIGLLNNDFLNKPMELFGMDYVFDTYKRGVTKTKRPIPVIKNMKINERGEQVPSVITKNIYDTLELFIAELASRKDQVKQQYPNLTNDELNAATSAKYNASNKYFKQLMDSKKYKDLYKVDIKNINIPNPNPYNRTTKIDTFLITPAKIPDKQWNDGKNSYNKKLFEDIDGFYSTQPEHKIFQSIIREFVNNNTYNYHSPYLN